MMDKKSLLLIAAAGVVAMMVFAACDPAEREKRNNPYKALSLPAKSAEFVGKGNDTFTFEFIPDFFKHL